MIELGQTLFGFGREMVSEAGEHARARSEDAIAPIAALLKQDKTA